MSKVQKASVVAATVGDCHFRADRPRCRKEPDWYAVMKDHLDQLRAILLKHKAPPLFYAGDIFHKWNAPPELINFLLSEMPSGYAVPGNHDLPYHNYEDRKKSAYWTLVKARKLTDLQPGQTVSRDGLSVTAFPFGSTPTFEPSPGPVRIALVHAYCWRDGHTHPGAPEDQHADSWMSALAGYTGLVFGDNHQAFNVLEVEKLPWVRNGGCFIRQTTSEMDVQPTVGLVWSDGSLTEERLDRRHDEFVPADEWNEEVSELGDGRMQELLEELSMVGKHKQDFRATLKRAADKSTVSAEVRRLVLDFMGEGK